MQDSELLTRYATSSDEAAFGEIVSRYLNLVHGVAFRSTGDASATEDVAQNTFAILARKAGQLSGRSTLGGWLMKTARLEAKKHFRTEFRRRRKHDALADETDHRHTDMDNEDQAAWNDALPHLDDALEQLSTRDREVISQRFYRNLKFREIASASGQSEDGARKRLSRALDRLTSVLRSRGAVLPAATIATGLSAELSKAAAGVTASSIASGGLTAAPHVSATALFTNTLLTMANTKQIAAALFIAAGTAGFQWHSHSQLTREVATLAAKLEAADSASSSGKPRAPITPEIAAAADRIEWSDLIELFEKTRLGGDASRRLFVSKIEMLDAQRQFLGNDLSGALDDLEAAGASARLVKELGTTLVMFADARDPAGCADAILEDDRIERWRLGAALEEFGMQDPDAALAWYEERKESGALDPKGSRDAGEAESALGSLIAGIAQTNLDAATELLATVPEQSAKRGIYRLAFVITEPVPRAAFLQSLGAHPQLQEHSITAYTRAQIESADPAAAWAFLQELPVERPAEELPVFMMEAVSEESMRDMNQAPEIARWIADNRDLLPNDGSVERTLSLTVSQWKIRDTAGGEKFEDTHPELFRK